MSRCIASMPPGAWATARKASAHVRSDVVDDELERRDELRETGDRRGIVDEQPLAGVLDGEEQIGVVGPERGVDEGSGLESRRGPVDRKGERSRQHVSQLCGRIARILEGAAEECVMGVRRHAIERGVSAMRVPAWPDGIAVRCAIEVARVARIRASGGPLVGHSRIIRVDLVARRRKLG
jgi:hypothetical protein